MIIFKSNTAKNNNLLNFIQDKNNLYKIEYLGKSRIDGDTIYHINIFNTDSIKQLRRIIKILDINDNQKTKNDLIEILIQFIIFVDTDEITLLDKNDCIEFKLIIKDSGKPLSFF